MDIFQTKLDNGKYRATLQSENPILVSYHDLIDMADEFNMTPDGIAFVLRHDDCPTPINHDDSIDGALEAGIWVYDRLVAFFDWMVNQSLYVPKLKAARTERLIA